jgi:sulfate permease, SulP family
MDSASYARSVREDTAELASYVLSDKKDKKAASFLRRRASGSSGTDHDSSTSRGEQRAANDESIAEVSEPSSPESIIEGILDEGPSVLSSMLKQSPPKTDHATSSEDSVPSENANTGKQGSHPQTQRRSALKENEIYVDSTSENTPLLIRSVSTYSRPPDSPSLSEGDDLSDVESQKPSADPSYRRYGSVRDRAKDGVRVVSHFVNPKTWDRHAIWQNAVISPLSCLPSVIVGLLLNILDALSYGKMICVGNIITLLTWRRYDPVPPRKPYFC